MMQHRFPDRCFPLAQFSGATAGMLTFGAMVLCGLWSGNSIETILSRAVAGLFAATLLGSIVGTLAMRVLRDLPAQPTNAAPAAATEKPESKPAAKAA